MAVTVDELLKRLEVRGKEEGTHPELLQFYHRLLHIQSTAEQHLGIPRLGLSGKAANERLEQGLPLLSFGELALDWALLKGIFAEVIDTFTSYPQLFSGLPKGVSKSRYSLPWLKEAVPAWFEGTELPSVTANGDDSESSLEDIIQTTLKPFLVSYSKALVGLVNEEGWRRGYCPICGGSPDFAFLDKERGARWLICSRCDAEWLFQRLECPYCGTKDQNALAYFTDDEGIYRLYVCEQCKRYLKALDRRQAKSEFLLPLERLFTLDIDAQARKYGYSPRGRATTRLSS